MRTRFSMKWSVAASGDGIVTRRNPNGWQRLNRHEPEPATADQRPWRRIASAIYDEQDG